MHGIELHWTHYVLLAVCAFAYWQRVPAISRVATVFLLNSAFVTMWVWFINPTIDPIVQLLVDTASAAVIMTDPADSEQGWIGFLFGARIGSSLAFIWMGSPTAAAGDYWHLMNMMGQVVIAMLLIWSEINGGQISGFASRLYRSLFSGVAGRSANR